MRVADWMPRLCLFLAVTSVISFRLEAQSLPTASFRVWSEANAVQLSAGHDSSLTDLRKLAPSISDASVVLFGEYPHGAEENLELRNRMIRWLITEQGFTAIAL